MKRLVTLVTGISLATGVGLYPSAAQYFTNRELRATINNYVAEVSERPATIEHNPELLAEARDYNNRLAHGEIRLTNEVTDTYYRSLLQVEGAPNPLLMGSMEIPSFHLKLPVYHGTTDDVLKFGAGHIYGTSLPVGGAGSHAALSAHNGVPDNELFTRLPEMQVGDYFSIFIAGETFWYQVDRILEVEPDALDAIVPEGDRDLLTLVTCVPIGVNNRRLLVTGQRSDPPPAEALAAMAPFGEMMPWWAVWFVGIVGGTWVLGRYALFRKDYLPVLADAPHGRHTFGYIGKDNSNA